MYISTIFLQPLFSDLKEIKFEWLPYLQGVGYLVVGVLGAYGVVFPPVEVELCHFVGGVKQSTTSHQNIGSTLHIYLHCWINQMTLYLNDVAKNTESESASRKLYLYHYQYMYTVCGGHYANVKDSI